MLKDLELPLQVVIQQPVSFLNYGGEVGHFIKKCRSKRVINFIYFRSIINSKSAVFDLEYFSLLLNPCVQVLAFHTVPHTAGMKY